MHCQCMCVMSCKVSGSFKFATVALNALEYRLKLDKEKINISSVRM